MASHLQLAPAAVPVHVGPGPRVRSPIRVVLADDHDLVRSSVRRLLEGDPGVEVIAEAGDLAGAVRHVQAYRPCVLVLDLLLPDGSSLQAIGPLRERVPATRIVVMTMENSPAFAQSVLAAGAAGFVSKERADDELLLAVRAAVLGERYVSPRVVPRLRYPLLPKTQPAQEPIGPRLLQVQRLERAGAPADGP